MPTCQASTLFSQRHTYPSPRLTLSFDKLTMRPWHKHQHSINTLVGSTLLPVGVAAPSANQARDDPDQPRSDDSESVLKSFVGSSTNFAAVAGLPVSPTSSTPRLETVATFRGKKVTQEQGNPLAEGAYLYTLRFSSFPKLSPFDKTDARWAESFGPWKFNIVVDGVDARLWTVLQHSSLGRVWDRLTKTLSDLLDAKEAELEEKRPPGEEPYLPCPLGLYLIGPDKNHAAPFICVLPSSRWSGKAVCKILKESGHLDHDNLQCGYVWGTSGNIAGTLDAPGMFAGPLR